MQIIAFAVLCAFVAAAAVFDLRTRRIPNLLTHGAILGGLALWLVMGLVQDGGAGALHHLGRSVLGFAAAIVPFGVIYALGGLGGGDVKMMGAVGAISASWKVVLGTTFYGFVLIGLFAIVIMIRQRIVLRTLKRLVSTAMMAAARVRPVMPDDSPRIAVAAGLAIGAVLAGCEHLLGIDLPWSGVIS